MVRFLRCLLLIHGLLSNHRDFKMIIKKMEGKYDKIFNYDMPGHGDNKLIFNEKNIIEFYINIYRELKKNFEIIDILGYSFGGVIASYIASQEKVDNLILLSPSFKYLNFKNYRRDKTKISVTKVFPKRNINYLFRFYLIVKNLKKKIKKIDANTLIIWGDKDYLVKESSGNYIYDLVKNNNKMYIIVQNYNHFNIVFSEEIINIIYEFLYK